MRASVCCSRAVCRPSEQKLDGPEITNPPVNQGVIGRIFFQGLMSKQHFRKQHALAAAGKRPRMTPSKLSRFRLHALQKAKRVERANGDQFEAHHMCFTQRQLFEHFVSDGRIGDVDDERHARLSLIRGA
jgi:hypothetical protein